MHESASERLRVPGLVGDSPALRTLAGLVHAAAATDVPVLIEGETGSGKELVARALVALGARRSRPFVTVNCGAIPESVLDAELFGHRAGAFTGADRDRRGLLDAADGGTLFLDEITSMSASFQSRLLRVLENAEIRAVGSDRVRRVDLRVVAATNRPLAGEVAAGRLRADLYYRLHVFPIALPPLRERRADIPALATHLLAAAGAASPGLTAEALACLCAYEFPGNVRELRNELVRAATLAGREPIRPAHLSLHLRAATAGAPLATDPAVGALSARRREALATLERRLVCEALERHGYNLSRAAHDLAISRFGLRKRMRRLGLAVRRSLGPPPLAEAG